MTPDRRHAVKHGPFTTWQWAVIGAYLVAIVLSIRGCAISDTAVKNTERLDKYACLQITYLEAQSRTSVNPESRANIAKFTHDLRPFVPSCPPPETE